VGAADPGGFEFGAIAMSANALKTLGKAKSGRDAVRFGRPPKELAGEVDGRILAAARKVFLQRGFEGASIDEIAEVARSGKRTIYARFADKRALFTATVTQDIRTRLTAFKAAPPIGATIEERLTSAAIMLLHWALDSEGLALMRLAIAEAYRFPDLASAVNRTARELSTDLGARLLGDMTQSDEVRLLPAFAPERLATTARFFLDLVAVPMLFRALFEVDIRTLDAEVDAHVAPSVAFFLAACRNDGVGSHEPSHAATPAPD
jgi:AcrR family transcriptional regulator